VLVCYNLTHTYKSTCVCIHTSHSRRSASQQVSKSASQQVNSGVSDVRCMSLYVPMSRISFMPASPGTCHMPNATCERGIHALHARTPPRRDAVLYNSAVTTNDGSIPGSTTCPQPSLLHESYLPTANPTSFGYLDSLTNVVTVQGNCHKIEAEASQVAYATRCSATLRSDAFI
jgi:hypothetical protein